MPGTIQVSILELIGLPFVSTTSSMVVKISLGKQMLETSVENGNISLPLTTLRDNLVVEVHDSEGNVLAHTGVQSRLIIEKGSWDDVFPFEGGGQVHMKLTFVLNDVERQRVRTMRESALRKKQEERLMKGHEHSELSLFSEDGMKHVDHEGAEAFTGTIPELSIVPSVDDTHHTAPSPADILDETFNNEAPATLDLANSIVSAEEVVVKESPTTLELANSTGSADEVVVSSQVSQDFQQGSLSEENPSEKVSSNVRTMIVAFESSLSKEEPEQLDVEPNKFSSIMTPEPTRTTLVFTSEEESRVEPNCIELENTEEIKAHVGQESDPSIIPMCTIKEEEEIVTHEGSQPEGPFSGTGEFSSRSHDQSYMIDECSTITDSVDDHNLEQGSLEELDESSTSEINEFLESLGPVVSGEPHSSECQTKEDSSNGISVIEGLYHQLPHDTVNTSKVPHEEECISTGNSLEQTPLKDGTCPSARSASLQAIEPPPCLEPVSENHQQLVSTSVAPEEELSSVMKKPEPVRDSKHPMGQAIKITLMVGFGLFIILTSQRRSR